MSSPKKQPKTLEEAESLAIEAALELENEPGIDDLFQPQEQADSAPFYFVLRCYIQQLKDARIKNNLTLTQVAEKSGLAMESLSRLETGSQSNPTWKTLGLYAIAVGRRPELYAALARSAMKAIDSTVLREGCTTSAKVSGIILDRSDLPFILTAPKSKQDVTPLEAAGLQVLSTKTLSFRV